jgi:hypothetical protein
MALRAAVHVALPIEDEIVLAVEISSVREVGQRDVGADAGVLDGHDVLGGAVLGIARHLVRPDLPPKADPPQQVAHRLALHDVGRRDQGGEDDASLTSIHHVMVVVTQSDGAPVPHGEGIGIGGTDAKVARAPVATMGRAIRV